VAREDITRLLKEWRAGDEQALHQLTPLVYKELQRKARAYLARERQDHSWQPTVLVNEAFLKLVDCQQVDWQDRNHFFRLAAKKMREILVDYARRKRFEKRGGPDVKLVPLEKASPIHDKNANAVDLIVLNSALEKLELIDPRKTQIVEMRFFAGLSIEEIAEASGLAVSTVHRELHLARIWLFRAMQHGDPDET
jgi:RNA polymerase sigma factor (TIGR02999 family)